MRLLLVAPPGAGKGTQAERLAAHYSIAHLSSGDLLRKEVAAGTPIGRVAADYLARGDLVPDELVIEMLTGPVLKAASAGGYILDGFPRTLHQAEEAYEVAKRLEGIELQAVVHLEVSRRELRRRLFDRAHREGRSDDTQAVISHRIELYDAETAPLLGYYGERGLVIDIDGGQPVDRVFADIVAAVDRLSSNRPY
jgi:adenylate kinase